MSSVTASRLSLAPHPASVVDASWHIEKTTFEHRFEALKYLSGTINSLMLEEDEEDFIYHPTRLAFDQFENIVVYAYVISNDLPFINPIIAPDGIGGLKFDWRESFEYEVRLYISGQDRNATYLYARMGERDFLVEHPTANQLAAYFKILT